LKKKDYNYAITDSPPLSVIQHVRLRFNKRKQKQLLMQFKMNGKKPDEDFALLKLELEEENKIEDILKQQL
jgi:hypothetical protein